ncbi:MAG: fluoride efflux transporter CrcB [Myxococcales bacterium]|nr:MAG: fluoride efflux transporter CrcB [Myxococcales bacterium]
MPYSSYLLIALGGASGALVRVFISRMLPETINNLPLPILAINILGCLLMGLLVELMALDWSWSPQLSAFLVPGFLGGFTTFSSFALEFGILTDKHTFGLAFSYVLASVVGGLLAFFCGLKIVRLLS